MLHDCIIICPRLVAGKLHRRGGFTFAGRAGSGQRGGGGVAGNGKGNCLKRAGISTVAELTQKTEDEMMKVRNLGKKSLKEVKEKLLENNLSFRDYNQE